MAPLWFWLVIHFHLYIKILVSVTLILGASLVLGVFRKPTFLFSVTSPPAGPPNVRSIIDSRHWYPVLSNAGSTRSQQHRGGIWNKARRKEKQHTNRRAEQIWRLLFWWELTDRLERSVLLLYFLSLFCLRTREGGRRSRRIAETQFPPFRQGKYGFFTLCVTERAWRTFLYEMSLFFSGPHDEFMDDTAEALCWVTACLPSRPVSKHSIYRKQDVHSAPPHRRTNCDGLWLDFL